MKIEIFRVLFLSCYTKVPSGKQFNSNEKSIIKKI